MPTDYLTFSAGEFPLTTTNFAIPYRENIAGYQESFEQGSTTSVRVLECPWARRFEFMYAILGYAYVQGSSIRRYIPEVHPEYPWMFPTRMDLEGGFGLNDEHGRTTANFNTTSKLVAYNFARFRVTYQNLTFDVLRDDQVTSELQRYVTRNYKYANENFQVPGNTFEWATTTTETDFPQIPEIMSKPFPTVELEYKWHQVPQIPTAALTIKDKVNQSPWDGYAAGTLLYDGLEIEIETASFGLRTFNVIYKMLYRPTGHNVLYRRSVGDFRPIQLVGRPSQSLYATADFNQLFQLP